MSEVASVDHVSLTAESNIMIFFKAVFWFPLVMLQQNTGGMLPQNVEGWLTLIAIIGGALFTVWSAWRNVIDKINGLGGRVSDVEQKGSVREGRLLAQEQAARDQNILNSGLAERVARTEKAVDGIDEHVTEMKLEILAALHENQQAQSERDAKIRERIVRIETINSIERKLGRKLTEIDHDHDER